MLYNKITLKNQIQNVKDCLRKMKAVKSQEYKYKQKII